MLLNELYQVAYHQSAAILSMTAALSDTMEDCGKLPNMSLYLKNVYV